MISKIFFSLIFLIIVQYGLVFSADELGPSDSKPSSEIASMSLPELLSTFNRTHHDAVDWHLSFMLIMASAGYRLYNLPVNLSAECWRTARANSLMLEKLAVIEETFDVMLDSVDNVTRYLQKQTELLEHPLELVCRQIEKRYAEDSNLITLFKKAREDAVNFTTFSDRPPYFHKLITIKDMLLKFIEKRDIPEIAKYSALSAFRSTERQFYFGKPMGPTIFARACRAVARKAEFAESMQKIFEKTINDVLPQIMANDRVEKYTIALNSTNIDQPRWATNMIKILYGYVAKDPVLKKEVEDVAPNVGEHHNAMKYATKDDFDFSKL